MAEISKIKMPDGTVVNIKGGDTSVQYTATLTAGNWVAESGSSTSYTYNLSLTQLVCGKSGDVSPLISYTSNQTEYNYITKAVATVGDGIVFTAKAEPKNNIGIIIIDKQ